RHRDPQLEGEEVDTPAQKAFLLLVTVRQSHDLEVSVVVGETNGPFADLAQEAFVGLPADILEDDSAFDLACGNSGHAILLRPVIRPQGHDVRELKFRCGREFVSSRSVARALSGYFIRMAVGL